MKPNQQSNMNITKCSKGHIEVSWDQDELFTCPCCCMQTVNDNLREVRNYEEDTLRKLQTMVRPKGLRGWIFTKFFRLDNWKRLIDQALNFNR